VRRENDYIQPVPTLADASLTEDERRVVERLIVLPHRLLLHPRGRSRQDRAVRGTVSPRSQEFFDRARKRLEGARKNLNQGESALDALLT